MGLAGDKTMTDTQKQNMLDAIEAERKVAIVELTLAQQEFVDNNVLPETIDEMAVKAFAQYLRGKVSGTIAAYQKKHSDAVRAKDTKVQEIFERKLDELAETLASLK